MEILVKEMFPKVKEFLKEQKYQVTKELRSVLPFILPFLQTACVFFVLWIPPENPGVVAAIVKCLPILCLISYVFYHGIIESKSCLYNKCICLGLCFSVLGDALLIWQADKKIFILGMLMFAIGHVIYMVAFGKGPFGLKEFILCVIGTTVMVGNIWGCLSTTMKVAIFIYGVLLGVNSWRALARFSLRNTDVPWRKIYAASGMILFVFSDVVLAYNKFCSPVPGGRAIVMSTYYAAQCCIALSSVNHHSISKPPKLPAKKLN